MCIGAYEDIAVYGAHNAAALGVTDFLLLVGLSLFGQRCEITSCIGRERIPDFLFVQNDVRAFSRVDGKRSVPCHIGDDVAVHAGAVDNRTRIYIAAICMHANHFVALDVHTVNIGIERHSRTVLNCVVAKRDSRLVGRNHTCACHIHTALCPRRRIGFDFFDFLFADVPYAFDAEDFCFQKEKRRNNRIFPTG